MVFFTSQLAMVVKNLKGGGRMWNKPWGAKRMTRAQKVNRRAAALRAERNRAVLRAAALLEPHPGSPDAVRLERPLAAWRQKQMAGHVARARRALESGGVLGVGGGAVVASSSSLLGGVGAGGGSLMGGSLGAVAAAVGGVRQYGSLAAAAAVAAATTGTGAAATGAAAGRAGDGVSAAWAALRRMTTK